MTPIPLLPVCLANVAVESLLYGIFFVLNTSSLVLALQYLPRSLSPRDSHQSISTLGRLGVVLKKPMFLGTAPLFMTVTAHWVCTVFRSFEAFVTYKNGTEPVGYYLDISQPTYVLKTGLLFASVIISDSMMVYRLWVVWNYNYRIIFLPAMNLLAFIACGIGTTHLYAVAPPGTPLVNYLEASKWIIADVVLSVCTNVYSTTLIAWRVWLTYRASRTYGRVVGSSNLMAALAMFVESALLFSIWVLFFASLYGAKSSLESLAEDNIAVMAGIAFSLINVRIVLGRAALQNGTGALTTVLTDISTRYLCRCSNGGSALPSATSEEESLAYPMNTSRRMAVHIHQIQTSDRGHGCVPIDIENDLKLRDDNDADTNSGMTNTNAKNNGCEGARQC